MNKTKPECLTDWITDIIQGPGGLNVYQRRGQVEFNESDRIAAARWTIECLCNPSCEGSDVVLEQIIEARRNGGLR